MTRNSGVMPFHYTIDGWRIVGNINFWLLNLTSNLIIERDFAHRQHRHYVPDD